MNRAGEDAARAGGAKRLRGRALSILPRARVGERPAAAGAERGVEVDLDTVSSRGVQDVVVGV